MNRAVLSLVCAAALAACGGGGGSDAPQEAPASTPKAEEPPKSEQPPKAPSPPALVPPKPASTNCVEIANYVQCDLVAGAQVGVGVPAGAFAKFTNRTGEPLQVNSAEAFTGERDHWSEWCAYSDQLITGQFVPGTGEVGCGVKNAGEDYAAIRWGNTKGLIVQPGGTLILNSSTMPTYVPHTYSLDVQPQTRGIHVWRQPKQDALVFCNGQRQATEPSAWQNTSGRDLHVVGAGIYAVSPNASSPNRMSGGACVLVVRPDGSVRDSNCDDALRERGDVELSMVVAPGEFLAAQAMNTCQAPAIWDWAAFIRVY